MYANALFTLAALTGLSAGASGAVIMDQIGAPDGSDITGTTYNSQFYEPGLEIYNIAAMDDFLMPFDGTITSVEAVLSGWSFEYSGLEEIVDYTIAIYESPAAAGAGPDLLAAAMTYEVHDIYDSVQLAFTGTEYQDLVQFDTNLKLDAGTYWVAVIPENWFEENGRSGVMGSDLGNLNAALANPRGGLGLPDNWETIDPPANLAYRLQAIPGPGASALLGLAGLISRRRR